MGTLSTPGGRPGRGELAERVGQGVERHRCHGDREADRAAEHRRCRIDGAYVDQDPRPEPALPPGGLVLTEADLVPGAARDLVEGTGMHSLAGDRLELGEADRRERPRIRARSRPNRTDRCAGSVSVIVVAATR